VDYIDTSTAALPNKLSEPVKFDAKIKELQSRCVCLQLFVCTSIHLCSPYNLGSLIGMQMIMYLN
jgi:hypothetical protein